MNRPYEDVRVKRPYEDVRVKRPYEDVRCELRLLIIILPPMLGVRQDVFNKIVIILIAAEDLIVIIALPNRNAVCTAQQVDAFGGVHFKIANYQGQAHAAAG